MGHYVSSASENNVASGPLHTHMEIETNEFGNWRDQIQLLLCVGDHDRIQVLRDNEGKLHLYIQLDLVPNAIGIDSEHPLQFSLFPDRLTIALQGGDESVMNLPVLSTEEVQANSKAAVAASEHSPL